MALPNAREHPQRAAAQGWRFAFAYLMPQVRDAGIATRLRFTALVASLVLGVDWVSKALMLQFARAATVPHYTHPNPAALLLVLAAAPLLLYVVRTPMMVWALGVCVGGCSGNLFQRALGMPVTDFIPLPHLLSSPSCGAYRSCTTFCNVADLALWGSVPLLVLAFVVHAHGRFIARHARGAAI